MGDVKWSDNTAFPIETSPAPTDHVMGLVSGANAKIPIADLPAGPTGPTGATGPAGPTGATGATGPTGSGGALSITDGTHTVAGTTSLTVTGGTVGGTTPNATLDVSGGISGLTTNTIPKAASPTTIEDSSFVDAGDGSYTLTNTLNPPDYEQASQAWVFNNTTDDVEYGLILTSSGAVRATPMIERYAFGSGNWPTNEDLTSRGFANAPTAVQTNDRLYQYQIQGYGATNYQFGMGIECSAAGDWTDSNHPVSYTIMTSSGGGAVTRIQIDGAGNVILPNLPTADPHILGALFVTGPIVPGTPLALMMSTG